MKQPEPDATRTALDSLAEAESKDMLPYVAFMRVTALVGLAFGAVLLLAPQPLLGAVEIRVDAAGELVSRLLGATMIEASLTQLAAAAVTDARVRSGVLAAGGIGVLAGGLVLVLGTVQGTCGPVGWGFVAVYALLLAGFVGTAIVGRR